MIEHTKEPWEVERKCDGDQVWFNIEAPMMGALKSGRPGVVADTLNRDHVISPEEDQANARRIVACVNALKGIRTEAIEAGLIEGLLRAARDSGAMA